MASYVTGRSGRFLASIMLLSAMLVVLGTSSGCAMSSPEDDSSATGAGLRKDDPASWKDSQEFVTSIKKDSDGTLTTPKGALKKTEPTGKDAELVLASENQSQLRPTHLSCGGDILGCRVCCGDFICCGGCDAGGPRVCCGQHGPDPSCGIHW
jgi:hypothetical protein